MRHAQVTAYVALISWVMSQGCQGADDRSAAGLVTASQAPFGPSVIYDPLRKPVPEVPFPNDLLLAPSETTASGTQWNISTEAPSAYERQVREHMNQLEGFGVYSPVFVPFDGPLDLSTVTDESVLIVNIEPGHPRRGETVPLDLGRGHFPEYKPVRGYWPFDDFRDVEQILLSPDNDTDLDGDGVDERASFWEVETNTLFLRPIIPLASGARHAVLITRDVAGEYLDSDGVVSTAPVRSPWVYKAHASQAAYVSEALELVDLESSALAFGWTYTTMDAPRMLKQLRDGFHGQGPLARLEAFAASGVSEIRDQTVTVDNDIDRDGVQDDPQDSLYIVQAEFLTPVLDIITQVRPGLEVGVEHVDYFVAGSFFTPDLRTGADQTIGVNFHTGQGEVGEENVPYFLSVPKPVPGRFEPPFPVMIYFHGTTTSRIEPLLIANSMARVGIATLSFDQVGHGPIVPDVSQLLSNSDVDDGIVSLVAPLLADLFVPEQVDEFYDLELPEVLEKFSEVGFWNELALHGRTIDQNGDGLLESSEGFFWGDPFRLCASFIQDLSDFFHIVRVLRGFDPAGLPPAISEPWNKTPAELMPSLRAGDFNTDGVLDIGGPDVMLSVGGTSLGGIHSVMAAAVEPEVSVATPIVAGGGMLDILTRTDHGATTEIFHQVFGPLVVGCPDQEGGFWLSWNNASKNCQASQRESVSFGHLTSVPAGSLIRVVNQTNGEVSTRLIVDASQGWSTTVASDVGDTFEVMVISPVVDGQPRSESVSTTSPFEGFGQHRNTPRFRRFIGLASHPLSLCDPLSYARDLFLEPPPGHDPVDVLMLNALQDVTVPISTGVQLALSLGLFGSEEAQWRPIVDGLIDSGVMDNSDYDVDDLLRDNPEDQPPLGPFTPVVSSVDGQSSIRFADVDGYHEWLVDIDQTQDFDAAAYSQQQLALFHWSRGAAIVDDLCIEKFACEAMDDPEANFAQATE